MPTDAGDAKRVLIAASGMGCTAAHAHLKALLAGGAQAAVVVSEEENDAPVLLEEMKDLAPVETAAGDGTYRPVCGAVLEKLGGVDLVLAFGPAQMVKAVADATRETGVRMIAGDRRDRDVRRMPCAGQWKVPLCLHRRAAVRRACGGL